MHTIFWPRRRWISRFDIISILEGFIGTRGNRARGTIVFIEKLGIIRELVKKL
jgi:hypothetical protein